MENEKIIAELRRAGLNEKEALIYGVLLELGGAYPSKIAQITHINRSTAYKILDDLAIKGLINEIEKRKKIYYQIEKPEKLLQFSKNKVQKSKNQLEYAQKILPELEGLFSLIPNKPKIRFFEGLEGVLEIYEEHIKEKKQYEMVAYSNVEDLMKLLPKEFVTNYIKKKQFIGITTRAIFPDTKFNKEYNKNVYNNITKNILIENRFIPKEDFPYQGDITMYGENKVSIINFFKNGLFGVIIEDETISGMMRMIFNLAWKGVGDKKGLSSKTRSAKFV